MTAAHHCRDCGTRIILARTQAGKYQPLDWAPNHEGNVAAYCDVTGTWRARTLKKDAPPVMAPEKLYMPHAATCSKRETSSPAETPSNRGAKREVPGVTDLETWRNARTKKRRGGRRGRRHA